MLEIVMRHAGLGRSIIVLSPNALSVEMVQDPHGSRDHVSSQLTAAKCHVTFRRTFVPDIPRKGLTYTRSY